MTSPFASAPARWTWIALTAIERVPPGPTVLVCSFSVTVPTPGRGTVVFGGGLAETELPRTVGPAKLAVAVTFPAESIRQTSYCTLSSCGYTESDEETSARPRIRRRRARRGRRRHRACSYGARDRADGRRHREHESRVPERRSRGHRHGAHLERRGADEQPRHPWCDDDPRRHPANRKDVRGARRRVQPLRRRRAPAAHERARSRHRHARRRVAARGRTTGQRRRERGRDGDD